MLTFWSKLNAEVVGKDGFRSRGLNGQKSAPCAGG